MTQPNTEQPSRLTAVEQVRPRAQPKYLQIRDYWKYQHYKDRRPPWVKLHGEQIEDYEFQQLPDATKYHVLALTWLASKTDNKIPYDPAWIATRIGAFETVQLETLFRFGFLEAWQPRLTEAAAPGEQMSLPADSLSLSPTAVSGDASKMLASRYQLASPETETEAEAKTEGETDDSRARATARCCKCCGQQVFSKFSFDEALRLVRRWKAEGRMVSGRLIGNPGGLARSLHRQGTADEDIAELLRPAETTAPAGTIPLEEHVATLARLVLDGAYTLESLKLQFADGYSSEDWSQIEKGIRARLEDEQDEHPP